MVLVSVVDTVPAFVLLVAFATAVVLVAVVNAPSPRVASELARAFLMLCVGLALAALLFDVAAASGLVSLTGINALIFRTLIYRAWLVIGGALATAALLVLTRLGPDGWRRRLSNDTVRAFVFAPQVTAGLAYSAALAYVAVEIGKLANDADMRRFFAQSGLPIWANYGVIVVELLGAIGLCVSKTRVVAAIALSLILLGAIGTHYHNGDPSSDSLEAINLFVTLLCLVIILQLRRLLAATAS